jgi:PAS domain S-box-containing protein
MDGLQESYAHWITYMMFGQYDQAEQWKKQWDRKIGPAYQQMLDVSYQLHDPALSQLTFKLGGLVEKIKETQQAHFLKKKNDLAGYVPAQHVFEQQQMLSYEVLNEGEQVAQWTGKQLSACFSAIQAGQAYEKWSVIALQMLVLLLGMAGAYAYFYRKNKDLARLHAVIEELNQGKVPEFPASSSPSFIEGTFQALRKLGLHLQAFVQVSKQISQGIGHEKLSIFQGQGQLGQAFAEMQESLWAMHAQDLEQHEQAEKFHQFSEVLRDHAHQLDALCNSFLVELIRYLNGVAGSLYLLSDQEKLSALLELQACFALGQQRNAAHSIPQDEGLIGEAVRDKRTILLNKVPKGYLKIAAGLVESEPKSLLILPLVFNQQLAGVIEVASFKAISAKQTAFCEKVAESLASVVLNIQRNERTKRLLEEARLQAEMLQAQEEEMRQNMEELQATQEELERQKNESEALARALEHGAIFFEFDNEGKFLHVNQQFMQATLYSKSEIIGKPLEYYISPQDLDTEAYRSFKENIYKKVAFHAEVRRVRKDQQLIWLKCVYLPIIDKEGQLRKYTCVAIDITGEVAEQQQIRQKDQEKIGILSQEYHRLTERIKKLQERARVQEARQSASQP